MKIALTNEEKEAIMLYKNGEYKVINQLLVSDSNSDISLLREDIESESVKINYDRETLIRDLKAIKVIYELLQKIKIQRNRIDEWAYIRGTNVIEVERFRNETFIDKCLDATGNREFAEQKYALKWNEPAIMYIKGSSDIPFIDFSELDNINMENNQDILISPFTRIKNISSNGDLKVDNKYIKTYNVTLEKQELQGMPKEDKQNLYINILGNSDYINIKLNEVIRLEKENQNIYENIRKLEQLLAKTEQELDKKRKLENYSEYEIKLDEENLERLKREVNELKDQVKNIYEKIKECTEYITKWKKSVTIYIMSECYDIDVKYQDAKLEDFVIESNDKAENIVEENNDKNTITGAPLTNTTFEIPDESLENECAIVENDEEVETQNIEENNIYESANAEESCEEDSDVEDLEAEEDDSFEEEENSLETEMNNLNFSEENNIDLVNKIKEITEVCKENENTISKIIEYIGYLIYKQQSFAKIAGTIGGRYSALNNCFEMKKQAQDLKELNSNILAKAEHIYNFEKDIAIEKLDKISEVSLQVSTLLNYLNNPKSSVGKTKINRFEEMAIIEENELKRNIADLLLEIRGEAELKKLKDDIEIIKDKNPLQKILGIFTGRNKYDDFMIEQIIIRQEAIRKTLARNLRLDYNYSIHELIAETEMFIRENDDDELVEDYVKRLMVIEEELKQNFIILEEKVKDIINEREGRNLPIDEHITREELAELDTYRFLKKYRYDEKEDTSLQIEYQDTTANELFTIIDYIKTSKILV